MSTVNDMNQRWVADMGLPGPDTGKGERHLLCGPSYLGTIPEGFYSGNATTNRVLVLQRYLPGHGDVQGAVEAMKTVKVYPFAPGEDWTEPTWVSPDRQDWCGLHAGPVGRQSPVLGGATRPHRRRARL